MLSRREIERLRAPDLTFGEFAAARLKLYAGRRWVDTPATLIEEAREIWDGRGERLAPALQTTLADARRSRAKGGDA